MINQTVENLLPLLAILQQPAFCIQETGSIHSNPAAKHLTPLRSDCLNNWLGTSAAAYTQWDRCSTLELPVVINGQTFTAAVSPLTDGTLFLLSAQAVPDSVDAAMTVAAQILRQPLTELSVLVQQQADNPSLASADAITRQIYRLTRLTGNLADLSRLHNGTYRLHTEMKTISDFLTPLLQELEDLCAEAGRTLHWKTSCKPLMIQADFMLLERGILNLISNAIKFGKKEEAIQFWTEENGTYLLFRVRNHCSGNSTELLQAAFGRLEQRSQIPDPRWGIGLGLPITQYIAQLHGGMVTVEATQDGIATVTLTINRRRPGTSPVLGASAVPFEYTGGMRRTLVELSDSLPNSVFDRDAL